MASLALRAALAIACVHAASAFALGPLQSLGLRVLGRPTSRAWQMKAPSRLLFVAFALLAAGQAEREFIRNETPIRCSALSSRERQRGKRPMIAP